MILSDKVMHNDLKLFGKGLFTVKTCFLLSYSVTQYESVKYINDEKLSLHFLPLRHTLVFQVEQSLRLPSRNICLRHFSCYCLLFDSEQYKA